jgi:hypothetical protein
MRSFILFFLVFIFQIASQSSGETFYINEKTNLLGRAFLKNQDIIAKLYPGDVVELLFLEENLSSTQKEDEFLAKVRFESREGYLLYKYLQKEKPILKNKIIRERFEPKKYYTTANSLYLRDSPSKAGNIVTSLSRNSELLVTKFSENDELIDGLAAKWAFVQTQIGLEGWVFSGYITDSNSNTDEEEEDTNSIVIGKTK